MAVQRLNAGVDFLKGGLRAEAQPDDAGGHPLWQLQRRYHLTGLALMAGGAGGNADSLTAKVRDDILAGPALQRYGQHVGCLTVPNEAKVWMAVSCSMA